MDQGMAMAANFKAVSKEMTAFPFEELDGVPLNEDDLAPRPDYGPIGSKRRPVVMDRKVPEMPMTYMYTWASDYINKGGSLVDERLRGSGLVPGLPKPEKVLAAMGAGPKKDFGIKVPEQKRAYGQRQWSLEDKCGPGSLFRQQRQPVKQAPETPKDPMFPYYAQMNRRLSDSDDSAIDVYCSSRSSCSSGSAGSLDMDVHQSPEAGAQVKQGQGCYKGTSRDINDFYSNHGFVGSVRNRFTKPIQKGKYYIKFNE